MIELFQRMLALGDRFQPDFILSGMILGPLPESYDNLVTFEKSNRNFNNLAIKQKMENIW